MTTLVSDYEYELPPELIAQEPVEPRDQSRLMVLNPVDGSVDHKHFCDIKEYLRDDDVLVFNNTKVFKARLLAQGLEVFLLRAHDQVWEAMIRPGRKVQVGDTISFSPLPEGGLKGGEGI